VSQATERALAAPRRRARAGGGRERRWRGHLAEPVRTVARRARRRSTQGHVQVGVPHHRVAVMDPPSHMGSSSAPLTSILDLEPSEPTRAPLGRRMTPYSGLHPRAPLGQDESLSRPGDEPQRLSLSLTVACRQRLATRGWRQG